MRTAEQRQKRDIIHGRSTCRLMLMLMAVPWPRCHSNRTVFTQFTPYSLLLPPPYSDDITLEAAAIPQSAGPNGGVAVVVEVLVPSIVKGVWIVRAWLPSHAIPRPAANITSSLPPSGQI